MFDTTLRNAKDRIAEPLARRMSKVSPNTVTLVGVVIGLGSAVFAAFGLYWWGLGFWLLNRTLDGLDGLLARLHDKQDDFGGYLDILLDFVAYAALPVGLVIGAPSQERYLALAIMLAIYYINTASWMYLAGILEKRNAHDLETTTTIVMPAGLIGGFETIIGYCLFLIFPSVIAVLFTVFSGLLLITIFQRLIWAKRALA
jgi:phosphatidylglycerophosphate synthase